MSRFFDSEIVVKSWHDPAFLEQCRWQKAARSKRRFDEAKISRGQPDNAGQFAPKGKAVKRVERSKTKTPAKKQPELTPAQRRAEEARKKRLSSPLRRTGKHKNFVPATRGKDGKLRLANGKPLPKHIAQEDLKQIARVYTQVHVNPDPNDGNFAVAMNTQGNLKPFYSMSHQKAASQVKYQRAHSLNKQVEKHIARFEKDSKSTNSSKRSHATLALLTAETGIRPGSEKTNKGRNKTYGSTTLLAKHFVEFATETKLIFKGKAGKVNRLKLKNPKLVAALKQRVKGLAPEDPIFPDVNEKSLNDYFKSLSPKMEYTAKEYRTALANRLAKGFIDERKRPPKTAKEYKKFMLEVGEKTSRIIGHERGVCLAKYIDPELFSDWRRAANV